MATGDQGNGLSQEAEQQSTTAVAQPLGRQSSIYSLTMDELQHTLCESGKNFGSMNMDEFINSIWTAEENQAQAAAGAADGDAVAELGLLGDKGVVGKESGSLARQGSLSLPETLCRKTVDQVWSEIHCNDLQNGGHENGHQFQNPNAAQEQPTFGEMTLEDFLVRAGVVREQNYTAAAASPAPPVVQYNGMYQGIAPVGTTYVTPGMIPAARAAKNVGYHGLVVEVHPPHGFTGGMKSDVVYPQAQPQTPAAAANYCGSYGNGLGAVRMESPASPMSPECVNNQYGAELSGRGGRKRTLDGPVEKVVERRQRRMIKNRESAARSRARKQAYTVELEAELNQLKEENAHMKQRLAEIERQRKQQANEEAREKAQAQMQCKESRGDGVLKGMRRTCSLPN